MEAGADVEKGDLKGGTALLHAASSGYTEVVRVLAEAGASLECRTPLGFSPLSTAAANGHVSVVRWGAR